MITRNSGELPAARLLSRLAKVRQTAPGAWSAQCPAHDDKNPSLTLKENADGSVLVKCHAGCETAAVCHAVGLTVADLFLPQPPSTGNPLREEPPSASPLPRRKSPPPPVPTSAAESCPPDAVYKYRDERGAVLYEVVRFVPKGFRQRRKTADGDTVWNMDGVRRVPYRLTELLACHPDATSSEKRVVFVVEGEKDADRICHMGLVATTTVGGAGKWLPSYTPFFTGRDVVLLPDNDVPGRQHMATVGDALTGVAANVRVLTLPGLPDKGDVSDWVGASPRNDGAQLLALARTTAEPFEAWRGRVAPQQIAKVPTPETPETSEAVGFDGFGGSVLPVWQTPAPPLPVPTDAAVVPLSANCLPEPLWSFASDIAARIGCPVEYAVSPLLVALSAVVGRKVGICPKRWDNWTVTPNLWGVIVGAPGSLKSPAASEALRPLFALEKAERERFDADCERETVSSVVRLAQAEAAREALRRAVRDETATEESLADLARIARPKDTGAMMVRKRRVVNDVTVEKLGEILRDNPNGVLMYRDELSGFFRGLEKPGHESDRAFYLEAWNGDGSFDYDRIGRGNIHIPAVCISLFGTIQPEILRKFIARGDAADGLPQRLQILFYPDVPTTWTHADAPPDVDAHFAVEALFQHLAALPEGEPTLYNFAEDAQTAWESWRERLENRLLQAADPPPLRAHLSKYRSLAPSLALLFHLCGTQGTPTDTPVADPFPFDDPFATSPGNAASFVPLAPTLTALALCDCLATHAARLYGNGDGDDSGAHLGAVSLLERAKRGKIADGFTVRQVRLHGFTNLTTTEEIERAVVYLEAHGLAVVTEYTPGSAGGRPTERVNLHPEWLCGGARGVPPLVGV